MALLEEQLGAWKPVSRGAGIAWLCFYALFLLYAFADRSGFLILDYANLLIQEGGHFFLSWFGNPIMILGGTLGELLVPLLCAIYFFWQREPTGFAFCTFWFFENFPYIGTYMADARCSPRAEVTACLGDFPPAMMYPHESHRNPRPRAGRWILLRIESLCHRSHAWASPALRRTPSPARIADSFSSLAARNCAGTLSDRILRGPNPILRHYLGCRRHLPSTARRRASCLRCRWRSLTGMALGRRAARRRNCPHCTRHQSQRARRRQCQPRATEQLGAEFRRRRLSRLADMDGHRSSRCHDHHRCCTRRAFRLLALPSLPLRPPRVSAPARCMIFVLERSDPV